MKPLPREPGVVLVGELHTGHDCWDLVYHNPDTRVTRRVKTVNGKRGMIMEERWHVAPDPMDFTFDTYQELLHYYGYDK